MTIPLDEVPLQNPEVGEPLLRNASYTSDITLASDHLSGKNVLMPLFAAFFIHVPEVASRIHTSPW
jgi:hypothetical protein